MARCTSPLLAARLYKPDVGKSVMKIFRFRFGSMKDFYDRYGQENTLFLPCGHCPACLARRAKEWSVRCALESMDHKENCFVTLTYDPEHYPNQLVREDLMKFVKTLRNKGLKIRYFGCAEQGDKFGRWHFHILLFGYFPKDSKPWAKSEKGIMQYQSKFLTECWKKGLVTVAEFSPFAAQYVAGYCVKKFAAADGSFHIQSTKPGIGAGYFLRHIEDVYDSDKLILSFGSHKFSVPRYFDKLAEQLDLDLSDIKLSRLEKANLNMMESIRSSGCKDIDEYMIRQREIVESNAKIKRRSF